MSTRKTKVMSETNGNPKPSRSAIRTRKPSMEPATSATPVAAHEQVALEAFLIWERQGRPHGLELQHWLEAEQRVQADGAVVVS